MSKNARRIIIPLIIGAVALGIIALVILNPRNQPRQAQQTPPETTSDTPATEEGASDRAGGPAGEPSEDAASEDASQATPPEDETDEEGDVPPDSSGAVSLTGLRAHAPAEVVNADNPPGTIGSLDWRQFRFLVEFSPAGAGIERITLNNIWETAQAKRDAADIMERVEKGQMTLAEGLAALPRGLRYVIQQPRQINFGAKEWDIPAFSLLRAEVRAPGGEQETVLLWSGVWSREELGGTSQADRTAASFVTEIRNDAGEPVLRIHRTWRIGRAAYDLTLEQRIENLTGGPLEVTLYSYGMSDLDMDRAKYIDRRAFRFGHLMDTVRYPARQWVETDEDLFLTRGDVLELGQANYGQPSADSALWPNETSGEHNYELSWLAVENRYFAVAVHPAYAGGDAVDRSLEDTIAGIEPFADQAHDNVVILMRTPHLEIPGGGSRSLDLGIYAGPLDRSILMGHEPYETLKMGRLIIYQMSMMCAFCTFQWLAILLLWFLSIGHSIFFDWGVAIILLVVVVRLALHPITKKSQVSMQRFGKVMQKLKPEIDKLQEKYRDEPKRMQQEQMRLWKEYGVSPFSCLGFLPLFLQMPIWIALYAMLYFAWELRHEAAFWGVFQLFWDWPFLGDLSSGDHFFYEFPQPYNILWWNLTGLNLLPILMGGIFWVQQKYLTPQTGTMTPEQKQMQTMMRIMTVFLFPIMLYSAPSGLTLYIMTSSIWGILESRRIRKHVEQMDIEKPIERRSLEERQKMKANPKDPYSRAWQMATERAKAKREAKQQRSYKKRK